MNKNLLFCVGLLAVAGPLTAEEPSAAQGYRRDIQIAPLLRATTDAAGQPLAYPVTDQPQVTAVMVEIPPGAETGWHKHPFPCFAYILSGALTVEMEGGKVHQLSAGQALAESVNVMHNGKNVGAEPVKLVMFVMGEREKPFTVRAPIAPGSR
jgi:quercetin dioxygenase-like cupin family protein